MKMVKIKVSDEECRKRRCGADVHDVLWGARPESPIEQNFEEDEL